MSAWACIATHSVRDMPSASAPPLSPLAERSTCACDSSPARRSSSKLWKILPLSTAFSFAIAVSDVSKANAAVTARASNEGVNDAEAGQRGGG